MTRSLPATRVATLLALLSMLIAAGCAAPASRVAEADLPTVLAERAEARWAGLIEGDFAKAYSFETPAYREITPLRLYASRFGAQLRWNAVEVIEVVPDEAGATALVRLMVFYTAMDAVGGVIEGQRPVEEHWIRTGGDWWHTN
ncbi:MAG: hypothetical protein AB7I68_08785 [Porticoccaceae bacterium]